MARSGKLVENVPAYRRMAAILFERRNESVVYFEDAIDLTDTLPFIDRWNASGKPHVTLFTLLLYTMAKTLEEHPRLNRFVAGGRLYQRDGVWLSFAVKRSMEAGAPLRVVKRRCQSGETLESFVAGQVGALTETRTVDKTYTEREISLFLALPHRVLRKATKLVFLADDLGLLPDGFLKNDPFFASAFLANLGSVGGAAAYHHLYEYGDIPIFCTLGRINEEVVAHNGQAVVRKVARVKFSYDERIEDGFNAVRALQWLRQRMEAPTLLVQG